MAPWNGPNQRYRFVISKFVPLTHASESDCLTLDAAVRRHLAYEHESQISREEIYKMRHFIQYKYFIDNSSVSSF